MRCLHVKNGLIVNIVEWPVPPETHEDADVVPAVTGTESVGQAFDMTDTLKERRISRADVFIFQELYRLTNGLRAVQTPAQAALTVAQYKAFIKTQIQAMLGHSPLSTRPLSTIEVAATGNFSLVGAAGSYAIAGQEAVLEKVGLPSPQLGIIQSAMRW